jgi:hypothetical protein
MSEKTMTADDAEQLARLLRSLCILREGQVLHVGGHVVGPIKKPKRVPVSARCTRAQC